MELIENVQLPIFQRSVVWNKSAQKALIKTISEGMPFGSLLLYEVPIEELKKSNGNKKYYLIDGLQRLSAITKYKNNKLDFLDFEELCQKYFEDYFNELGTIESKALKTKFIKLTIDFLKENLNKETFEEYDLFDILDENIPGFNFSNKKCLKLTNELLKKIITQINNFVNINEIEIPVIIYKGDKNKLADIYEKINTSGTQLSKYEVYAATWGADSKNSFIVNDKEILQKIEDRYIDMIEKSDISIENFKEGCILENKTINLFEYAYAIGKILRDKIPLLFNGDRISDTSKIDSIGFSVIAACCHCSIQGVANLPNYFLEANTKSMSDLKNGILDVSIILQNNLHRFIIGYDEKKYSKYVETQLVSMISTLFMAKYEINGKMKEILIKPGYKNNFNKILENIPYYYLYDKIKGYWDNSGDIKITYMLSDTIEKNRYFQKISIDSWRYALEDWMEESNKKPSGKSVNIINKLFLNYLMKLTKINMSDIELRSKKYDVEHIIPVERLEKAIGSKNCAISSICNLCFLTDRENRSKHENSFYEEMKDLVFKDLNDERLKQFYYPEKREILFVEEDNITKENYEKFLKDRKTYLVNSFISLIYN
jgi:hypothetical protein